MKNSMSVEKKVRTRIAPSPSGFLHIGTARTALFNFLFAKQQGGDFIVRIEDTDKARSDKKYEEDIFESFAWLGLAYDELYRQSERKEFYIKKIAELIKNNTAYISKEKSKNDESLEVEVVRLRNLGRKMTFEDTLRGEITFDTTELGDFVIARSTDDPLYQFAVVVDDADMNITHVIRGDDHISNTPRQILIQEAFGFERPIYTHIPMILASDRSKMSKRKSATAITEYRKQGFIKDALINYLALLGWNPGTEQEFFSLEELISLFSLEQLQKSGAVFDIDRLKWFNKEYRKKVPREQVVEDFKTSITSREGITQVLNRSEKAMDDILERFSIRKEFADAVHDGEFDFYERVPEIHKEGLIWKKDSAPTEIPERLAQVHALLEGVDARVFIYDSVKEALLSYAEEKGRGNVLWPLRYALSGKEKSPDPFLLAEALGKEETLSRIQKAIELWNN